MLNPQRVLADIDGVFLQFPDLAEDTDLHDYVLRHGTDFQKLVEFCLNEIREAETLCDALGERIAAMCKRTERLDRRCEALRALILKTMEHAQVTKWALPEATLSVRQIPPAVIITDENDIPTQWGDDTWKPNKTRIREALKEGKTIPGAILSNGGVGLTIRTK